jgi:hypothetical protein
MLDRRSFLNVGVAAALAGIDYEPATTRLAGKLDSETYLGASGRRETAYILRLDRAVELRGDRSNSINAESHILRRIQIVSFHQDLSPLVGGRVVVTGQVYTPITGHYLTPVALRADSVVAE